jgi:hypothetical protein
MTEINQDGGFSINSPMTFINNASTSLADF